MARDYAPFEHGQAIKAARRREIKPRDVLDLYYQARWFSEQHYDKKVNRDWESVRAVAERVILDWYDTPSTADEEDA